MSDTLGTLISALGWLNLLLLLAIAVIALVKLRATPAGLLLALGFGLMSLCGMSSKLYRTTALDPDSMDYTADTMQQVMAVMWVSSLASTVLWIVVAVGVALIPLSLRRLARKRSTASTV